MNTTRIARTSLLALTAVVWLLAPPTWADDVAKPGGTEGSEGEMTYTESAPHGATLPMHVLGGVLGYRVSHGVRAELYVLQAEHPERLAADGANHLFTVALKDEASGRLLSPAQVTLGFAGAGSDAPGVPTKGFQGMYRAGLRLPAPGEYAIKVAFTTSAGPVQLRFPYRYEAEPEATGLAHHHPGHSQATPDPVPAAGVMPVALREVRPRASLERSEFRTATPAVDLMDSNGKPVALRSLLDLPGPVLVNFIFTSCQAVCPMMSETFARLQRELGAQASGVRMVSISIDPEFDRPEVLRVYAMRLHAGPQWHFLTGSAADIERVQVALGTRQPNKMDHEAVVLMRGSPQQAWVRLQGLASASDLMRELQGLQP